ncbi:protein SOSEKI 2-like isoform X2 [Rhodamnia argentea]|uniref:Protein SOSEKI 2-like isoform X2 n=1 Tax=Rhodamnia argentea TaxID=178133 RepID=A0A8B8PJV6_9MYRT|nr:protein SOSEKI 2-like isoform X2 [Rhodamnia argentea]
MDVRPRRGGEMSSNRARAPLHPRDQRPQLRKVQVVYYLTRNGLLEHPHFMEVSLLADRQLRLRDVMERLTALRGKGMPSMYSWSCKRTYKNGYVWNDLSENEVIYPAEGAEYVLKGSEIISSSGPVGREPVHVHSKRIAPASTTRNEEQELRCSRYDEGVGFEVDVEEEEECELADEEKVSYTSSTTPGSRCSRGVSTDELDEERDDDSANKLPRDTHDPDSPPAPNSTVAETPGKGGEGCGGAAVHLEDGDPAAPSRSSSVLLQLIACGGNLAVPKTKTAPPSSVPRSGNKDLHRGALCKSATKAAAEAERDDEAAMIRCMSENPRFGNLQSEEKEYFSGSIVESTSEDRVGAGQLKKSNSFNEERSSKAGVGDAVKEEKREEKSSAKGKCIPRKMSMSSRTHRKML